MKALIDKDGKLWLERGGTMKKQECPYYPGTYCGDSCPLFGEHSANRDRVWFRLCKVDWQFDAINFTDERGAK